MAPITSWKFIRSTAPATYEGTSAGDQIEFQRNGKTESLHAGRGQETRMKWLLDKKNCLIIRTGEGFCGD